MNDMYRSGPEIEAAEGQQEKIDPAAELSKLKMLFQSRKFWVLLAAIVAIAGGYATGQVDGWQALQLLIAALAAYSTGIAIVDAGAASSKPAENGK
jgi:hypothetical protein